MYVQFTEQFVYLHVRVINIKINNNKSELLFNILRPKFTLLLIFSLKFYQIRKLMFLVYAKMEGPVVVEQLCRSCFVLVQPPQSTLALSALSVPIVP